MDKLQCKHCSMGYVRRSPKAGALERVLRTVHMYPYRCQLCAHRFWRVDYGEQRNQKKIDHDKREYQRLAVDISARFSCDQTRGEGNITNLSIRGCSLDSDMRPHHGAALALSLHLSDSRPPIEIDTAVVRSALGKRFGLQFREIDPADEERLRGYIETLIVTRPDNLRAFFLNL